MSESLLWRIAEKYVRSALPPSDVESTLGDLAEDYATQRSLNGAVRAGLWLLRETHALASAYRSEAVPRARRGRFMPGHELRHAWKRIVAHPGRSVTCAALLTLGIGLSTAMFSVVDSLLLQPAPFPAAERLVQQGLSRLEPEVTAGWRASGLFDAVETARPASFDGDPASPAWPGAYVTPGVFEMLQVPALRGRVFDAADAEAGADDKVLLSEVIWRTFFGADPTLVGRRITLDGTSPVVVGIMPASFRFPSPTSVIWRPLVVASGPATPIALTSIIGRLKAGVPRTDAEARTNAIFMQVAQSRQNRRSAPPLRGVGVPELGDFARRALWLLLAGVGLVFVVLCANVSSLLLAHLAARRREFGLCTALGASRGRLLRQAAAEHAIIAAAGVVAGVLLAWSLTSMVPAFFLNRTLNVIDVDLRALLIASSLGVPAVLMSGLVPAWLGTRADPLDAIRGSPLGGGETRAARTAMRGLLVAQTALACSLLVGSALLARSFINLVHADRGLDLEGVARLSVTRLDAAFPTVQAMSLGTAAIEEEVAGWPEVSALSLSREIPPSGSAGLVQIAGAASAPDVRAATDRYRVDPAFFGLYRIPILAGRLFGPDDTDRQAIIGERLAGQLWPGQSALGQTFDINGAPREVIGVAGEIRLPTLDADRDRPEFYVPLGTGSRTLYLNLRCRTACPSEESIRARLRQVHPVPAARLVRPSEEDYQSELRLPRAIAQLAGLFAVVAVITAAGGLFSVMTHAVGRRRREFGIRSALGASPAQVRLVVVRDGMATLTAGVGLGLAGGWIVARSLATLQYGITTADPAVWAAIVGTIALTSVAAAWHPARQAMRTDPVALLREE